MIKIILKLVRFALEIMIAIAPCWNQKYKNRYKLVIIKIDGIGDYVIAEKFLQKLAANNQPTLLITSHHTETLARNTGFYDVLALNTKKYASDIFYRLKTIRALSKIKCDTLAVPIASRFFTVTDSIAQAVKASKKYGIRGNYSNMGKFEAKFGDMVYSELYLSQSDNLHEIVLLRNFYLFITGSLLDTEGPKLMGIAPSVEKNTTSFSAKTYAVIAPGSSNPKKNWALTSFKQIADYLYEQEFKIVFIGSSEERQTAIDIGRDIPSGMVEIACGITNLKESTDIIRNSRIFIGNDSAMMHVAVALGIDTVCIGGGGHWGRFIPYPAEATTAGPKVITKKMNCFNCNWICSIDHPDNEAYPCISRVSVDSVKTAVSDILKISG
jgi:ADP-heptose:LPS heptosyltransferase